MYPTLHYIILLALRHMHSVGITCHDIIPYVLHLHSLSPGTSWYNVVMNVVHGTTWYSSAWYCVGVHGSTWWYMAVHDSAWQYKVGYMKSKPYTVNWKIFVLKIFRKKKFRVKKFS